MTWKLEFLNLRIKENQHAFFTYELLQQNQNCKLPFFPRTAIDCLNGRKNPYDIPKQKGEIRLVACDMAFIENNNNDNSIFSCIRLLPETTSYKLDSTNETVVDNGYRRIVPYMEHTQGGETKVQAVRIRELYEDFQADYIVLDTRNAGRNAVQIRKRSGLLVRKKTGTLRCKPEWKDICNRISTRNA